jgi:glycerate 2-kinase
MHSRDLRKIFGAALRAADPERAVGSALERSGGSLRAGSAVYDLGAYDRVIVVGAGKATARMARAAEAALGDLLSGGVIVVKYGHTVPLGRVEQVEASHPLPDEAGVRGTSRIMDLLRDADHRTLVLCLLSGGGSALLVAPAEGIRLADKQQVTDLLLRAGATINELNAVRKHLSQVKGGRLARLAAPATIAALALSDVIGDRLDVIASGPTVADPSTYGEALAVLDRYGLREQVPAAARGLLERGASGLVAETPKDGDDCFRNARTDVVGSLALALEEARNEAERLGYEAGVLTSALEGEARAAARFLAAQAREARATVGAKPRCLISGGETTVRVTGDGRGGRNQELALAFALEIEGLEGVTLLSAGTDGTDGPTDAAGAIVDGDTARRARQARIDPAWHLDYNDSYTFFVRLDAATGGTSHLRTGPTGTNVMDVQIMLISGNDRSGERL